MKPFALNLSKFKKIAQDEKSTTLQHLEGHQFKVMHSRLPLHMKKQLEGLPMYSGGVAHYDDGSDNTVSQADAVPDQKPVDVNVNVAQPAQPGSIPAPSQLTNPASEMAAAPIATTVTSGKRDSDLISQDHSANIPEAVRAEQEAAAQQRDIDIAKGSQIANIESGYNAALAKNQQNITDAANEMAAQTQHVASNVASINPNHYMESRSAEGKVMTALGLIAGGISSGVTGGPNPAMDFLNKQIDRDVAAQVQNNENQKTIYGFYHQLYGDKVLAANLAKVTMGDIRLHQLARVSAQLSTPQAIANYNAARAAIAIKNQELLKQNAGRLGTLQIGSPAALTQAPAAPAQLEHQETASNSQHQSILEKSPAEALQSGLDNVLGLSQATEEPEIKKQKSAPYEENHILKQDAMKTLQGLKYADLPHSDIPAIEKQLNGAVQAEKALGDIDGTFEKLTKETAGLQGRLHRVGSGLHNIVGETVSGAAKLLSNTEVNRNYDADKTALLGYVSSALKGTNVHGEQIQKVVDDNSPEAGDSAATIQKKRLNIKHFIKAHTDTSLLKLNGMSNE